ncbi:MAG: asparagine synthase (glutamine-hydrolyzing) [Clostridiales bacterium]|nr:asparagine synthase (glutamine-hydrolyzing) [Clostridiales bacterium]
MCGFVTLLSDKEISDKDMEMETLKKMTDIIKHRGPDDEGFYVDGNMCMGFRRLSIIDLQNGSQPFPYDDGRYRIVFNGEIYNYVELREDLIKKGFHFSTQSDTEVILAMYKYLGAESVKYLRGMFAFVIWDKQTKTMFGARDPFGIKPFYYIENESGVCCASEKKSLLCLNGIPKDLNIKALYNYLTFQFVPEPDTILKAVSILEPGHTITKKPGEKVVTGSYWSISFNPVKTDFDKRIIEIRKAMEDSVKVHMRSDVPVGAFLSGGIDSTIIVALASKINPAIKTFTVGFERNGYSEIDLAKDTAEELGVENISKVITVQEFIDELPKIIWHMDEPMADPAAVPLYFVAREARKYVKVVLSGEGSDELFGGYNIYREPVSLSMFKYIPKPAKKALKSMSRLIPEGVKGKSFIERGCSPIEKRYVGNAFVFNDEDKRYILNNFDESLKYENVTEPYYNEAKDYDDTTKMQYIDINTWLRGDILVKADRMTMANSLELRVPFLDKEVFNVASKLTLEEKIGNGTTKYALREAFKGIIPDSVITRKKLGFPVPYRHWLKDELYDWAVKLINESETDRYINKQNVLKMLEKHRKGPVDYGRRLWTILIFMLWHQIFIENNLSYNASEMQKQVAISKN